MRQSHSISWLSQGLKTQFAQAENMSDVAVSSHKRPHFESILEHNECDFVSNAGIHLILNTISEFLLFLKHCWTWLSKDAKRMGEVGACICMLIENKKQFALRFSVYFFVLKHDLSKLLCLFY